MIPRKRRSAATAPAWAAAANGGDGPAGLQGSTSCRDKTPRQPAPPQHLPSTPRGLRQAARKAGRGSFSRTRGEPCATRAWDPISSPTPFVKIRTYHLQGEPTGGRARADGKRTRRCPAGPSQRL